MKLYLLLLCVIAFTACTKTKHFDFDKLPAEIINAPEDSVSTDTKGSQLPSTVVISSMTNKYDLRNQLMAFGDSLCNEHGRKINPDNISGDGHTVLTEFANNILSNEHNGTSIAIEVDGEVLEYEHIETEYADLEFQFKTRNRPYRYHAIVKYHFKLSLNKNEDKAGGMKHLVFMKEAVLYSPNKIE